MSPPATASTRPGGQRARAYDVSKSTRTRALVLESTARLLDEVAYEDLRVRHVAEASGVAIGTIYRHFSGREHLVAELQLLWIDQLESTFHVATRDPVGRLCVLVNTICQSLASAPRVARATFLAAQSPDPKVRACAAELDARIVAFLRSMLDDEAFSSDLVVEPMRLAWQGAVLLWTRDLMSLDDMATTLDRTARTLVAGASREAGPSEDPRR